MARTKSKEVNKFTGDLLDKYLIQTDIYPLDFILKGGIRTSEMYQFVAESGLGKTTIALQIAGNLCSENSKVIYVDSESSINSDLLKSTGVYSDYEEGNFIYVRESVFSKLEQKLDDLLSNDDLEVRLIVIDSIATLIPDTFTNFENGTSITTKDTNAGSRQLTLFLNKYKALSIQKKFSIIVINQYRNDIDMRKGAVLKIFGPKNVVYNSDTIIQIKKNNRCYEFGDIVNKLDNMTDLVFEVVKSNRNPPKEYIPFCLVYGRGISTYAAYLYAMLKLNIITQTGAWYKIPIDGQEFVAHGINDVFFKLLNRYDIVTSEISEKIDSYYNENFRSLSIYDRM